MDFTRQQELLVPLLTFVSVVAIGFSILIAREQKRKIIEQRLEDDSRRGTGRVSSVKKNSLLQFLEKIGNLASHGHATTALWEQLIRAGYLRASVPAVYTGIKLLLFIAGLAVTGVLILPTQIPFSSKMILAFLGGSVMFFVPNLVLVMRLKKQHDEICRHLPDAIDLLEICVSSGIGLDMAWNIVADEIQSVSPVLASAMALSNFEMHLGAGRVEAMRHMAARTGVDQLSSLAAILIQTERFGTSIAETLRVFAVSMREERRFIAQESAEKMAVKMIVPMVLFIFPAVLIIVAGPAAIRIAGLVMSGY